MKLKACMINVSYSKSVDNEVLPKILMQKYSGRFSNIKEITILEENNKKDDSNGEDEEEVKDDKNEEIILGEEFNNWCIKTHYMKRDKKTKRMLFYQIAFEPILEKDERLEDFYLRLRASKDSDNIDYLRYYSEKNLFFYSEPKSNKKEKNSSVANTAGKFIVEVVKVEDNTILKSIEIMVKPSSLSYDDYLKMIRDLREIREDIVINNNSKVSVGQRYINKKSNIEEIIKELQLSLNGINNKPKSKLEMQYVKKKYHQINKITNKTLLEKSMFPYKNTFTSIDYKESFDFYENRILKQILINLKMKINQYKESYHNYVEGEERENSKVREYYEKITSRTIEEKKEELKKINEKNNKYKEQFKIDCEKNKIITSNVYLTIFKNNALNKNRINIKYDENTNNFILNLKTCGEIKGDEIIDIKTNQLLIVKHGQVIKVDKIIDIKTNSKIKDKGIYNKRLDISFETKNINEMIFLIECLENTPLANRNFGTKILLEVNIDINSIKIQGEETFFTIKSIDSISYKQVKEYSDKEKDKFFEKYFDDEYVEENLNMLNSILKKEEEIKNLTGKFINDNSWDALEKKVESMLNLDIFKGVKPKEIEVLKPTQIFISDNYYKKAYKSIKKFNDKTSIVDMKNPETILVKSICDIYELWCLFKIIQSLIINQRWKLLNEKTIIKDIDNILSSKDSNKDREVKFIKELRCGYSLILTLNYEGELRDNNNKRKTPDYQFTYEVINEKNEVVNIQKAYLDAKYRNYKNQGFKTYTKDIEEVAIEKYTKAFENTKNETTCSMIVHSHNNERYVNWGADFNEKKNLLEEKNYKLKAHGYGAFYLVPSDISNLNKFLRLLPEYHLDYTNLYYDNNTQLYYDEETNKNIKSYYYEEFNLQGYYMCWECGEVKNVEIEAKETKGGYLKYHCTCNNCNEFWVKNHCCGQGHHKLIKHRNNYHLVNKEKKSPWYLICPECGDEGNGINKANQSRDNNNFNITPEIPVEERIPF